MNPFSNTYKIVEHSNLNGETKYSVEYGNFLCRRVLDVSGKLFNDHIFLESFGSGETKTMDEVKLAIKRHQENLLNQRLAKITTKTIARI